MENEIMKDVRRSFHDLINKLNKITVKAGLIVELSREKDVNSMSEEELRAEYTRALEILSEVENAALEAGKDMDILKREILSEIGNS
jgi:hypothetical protein